MTPAGYNIAVDARRETGDVKYGQLISRCKVPKTIAMTFDDGPSDHTADLLDILKKADAKATFFVSGNANGRGAIDSTTKWTDVIKRMVQEGHQVGSHGWSHPDMGKIDANARKLDMVKNERALSNILGKYPTYMRPPYLQCSDAQGCLGDMQDLGYHVISYSHDSADWMYPEDLTKMKGVVDQVFNGRRY